MNLDKKETYLNYSEIKICRICENDKLNTLTCFYNKEMSNIFNNLKQIMDVKVNQKLSRLESFFNLFKFVTFCRMKVKMIFPSIFAIHV